VAKTVVSRQYLKDCSISGVVILDLPAQHRVPLSWLHEHACPSILLRTATDILPTHYTSSADIAALRSEVIEYRNVKYLNRRQWQNGSWSGNMLGIGPMKSAGIKDVGTVAQYRRLLELGVPINQRAYKLADRLFFKVLSRDETPSLWFEYQKGAAENPELKVWARSFLREGVTCALAHAGRVEDPRVRGSAHRVISDVSQFLRSEVAESPLTKKGSKYLLEPGAYPPSIFSVAMLSYMPRLQRERAGFVERLGRFLATPPQSDNWSIQIGKKSLKSTFHILGDPLKADSKGNTDDIPWSLHWIELIVRLGLLDVAPTAQRILARLLQDCDEQGTWNPKNLRTLPKSRSKLADFAFPLEVDGKTQDRRRVDVTFRLALIAKLAGWDLEIV